MFSQAEKGSMYRACSLLGQSSGARPVAYKNFYILLTFEKMRAFLPINIYGHAAVVSPILRLWFIIKAQKLK